MAIKKKYINLLFGVLSVSSFAQVGIHTTQPKGALHIVAKGEENTNSSTAKETDILITSDGKVGIGTQVPVTKMDLIGDQSIGALKIVDGSQADGLIMTSDSKGLGTWKVANSTNEIATGTFPKANNKKIVNSGTAPDDGHTYSQISIELTKGKWIVSGAVALEPTFTDATKKTQWIHARFSTSNIKSKEIIGFKHLGASGNNTGYASNMLRKNTTPNRSLLYGTSVIEVTQDTPLTIYFWIQNNITWKLDTDSPENYFYAVPIT